MASMSDIEIGTCVACRFSRQGRWLLSCTHPEAASWNPVSGWTASSSPVINRMVNGACGPEGILWEPGLVPAVKPWWQRMMEWLP